MTKKHEIYESLLAEAEQAVHGRRQDDHGHPLDVFETTAGLWSALLSIEVKTEQVPLMQALFKIARENVRPKRDNRVDIAGYSETLEMCIHEAERRMSVSQETEPGITQIRISGHGSQG